MPSSNSAVNNGAVGAVSSVEKQQPNGTILHHNMFKG